jgi:hypothetical protein
MCCWEKNLCGIVLSTGRELRLEHDPPNQWLNLWGFWNLKEGGLKLIVQIHDSVDLNQQRHKWLDIFIKIM